MVTLFVLSETLAKRQQQPKLEVKGSVPVTGFIHEAKDFVVFSRTTYKFFNYVIGSLTEFPIPFITAL